MKIVITLGITPTLYIKRSLDSGNEVTIFMDLNSLAHSVYTLIYPVGRLPMTSHVATCGISLGGVHVHRASQTQSIVYKSQSLLPKIMINGVWQDATIGSLM